MERWIWCNGRVCREEAVRLALRDWAVMYGASLFETLRCYRGYPFRLEAHLERLRWWMGELHLFERARRCLTAQLEAIPSGVHQLLEAERLLDGDARLRITVTAGAESLQPLCVMWAEPISAEQEAKWRCGVRVTLAPTPFAGGRQMPKWGNYGWHAEAQRLAWSKGFEETLWFTADGYLTEGTYSNLFVWDSGRLLTPPLEEGILAGVTREVVLEIAQAEGIECRQERLPTDILYRAQAVFLTNSVREVVPVVAVDATCLRTHPFVERLQEAYRRLVADEAGRTPPERLFSSLI